MIFLTFIQSIMPEGPEVKVMTDNIRMLIEKAPVLHAVTVIKDNFVKRTDGFSPLKLNLPQVIKQVNSKGKFTYMEFEDGTAIGITYGMTGNIRTDDSKHNAIKFTHETGVFYYHSTRHFGRVWAMTAAELSKKLDSLGHDILNPVALRQEELTGIWRKKNGLNICRLLIEEQELICGIGNYIKSEILYHVRVYPFCRVSELSDDILYALYLEARKIAEAAYIDGGASLYTYTGLTGDKSPFKLKLCVYDKTTDPEGNPILRVETPDKRTTHWVPVLQTEGSVKSQPPIKITIKPRPRPVNLN